MILAGRVRWVALAGWLALVGVCTLLLASYRDQLSAPFMVLACLTAFLVTGAVAAQLFDRATPTPASEVQASDAVGELLGGDLRDLSRIRMRALPLDRQPIAAQDVVGGALERLRGGGADRVVVRFPADGSRPIGRIDSTQTVRALVSLLENALRHSEVVELEVEQRREWLVLRVLDRGPGMPEGERTRVLDPLPTADHASGSARQRGIGLAFARSVAEAQEGSLGYGPRSGGGTVFELRLPAELGPSVERGASVG